MGGWAGMWVGVYWTVSWNDTHEDGKMMVGE